MLLLPYAIRASSERPRCPDDYSPSDHGPRVHRSELVLAYSIDPDAVVCCRPASPNNNVEEWRKQACRSP